MNSPIVSTCAISRTQAQGTAMALITAGVSFTASCEPSGDYIFHVAPIDARFLPKCCLPKTEGLAPESDLS